jgi:hypothetical protein
MRKIKEMLNRASKWLLALTVVFFMTTSGAPCAEAGLFSGIGKVIGGAVKKAVIDKAKDWVKAKIDKAKSWAERKILNPVKAQLAKVFTKSSSSNPAVADSSSGSGAAQWGSLDADLRFRGDNLHIEGPASINEALLGRSRGESLTLKMDADLHSVNSRGLLGINYLDLTGADAGRVSVDLAGRMRNVNIAPEAELHMNRADLRGAQGNIGLKMSGELNNTTVQRGTLRINDFTVNPSY